MATASVTADISRNELRLEILPQPDESTCGPTCLQAVYGYYKDVISLNEIIEEVEALPSGGTLAVLLGNHALARGYRATIHTCNLQVFDPSWFEEGVDLKDRLKQQAAVKSDGKLRQATEAYLVFLGLGGRIRFGAPSPPEIHKTVAAGIPILTGLSATYLHASKREVLDQPDDIAGEPVGHFVVVCGTDPAKGTVRIADPLEGHTPGPSLTYWVDAERLIASVLLGVLTYDANLLTVEPEEPRPATR